MPLKNGNLGAYRLSQLLGSGGMGEVYLAEHRRLKRACAVKVIRGDRSRDPQVIARFKNEVQATASLKHANTVQVMDHGTTDEGALFYVMEYLPGLNLQDLVDRTGPMPVGRVIHLLRQVCSALSEAHRQGIIHRDVKPGNIMAAERDGVYDVAKLLDFGLVKSTLAEPEDVRVTRDGALVGSPLYAAPEVMLGEPSIDSRADIYSLGATAYFLLTGRPVFEGERPLEVLLAHVHQTPIPPSLLRPGIPPQLEAMVLKCLAKSPQDRFASAAELEQELAKCAQEHPWTSIEAERSWRDAADISSEGSRCETDEFAETIVDRGLAA